MNILRSPILILPGAAILVVTFADIARAQEQVITKSAFEAGLSRYSRPPEEWRGKARRFTRLTTSPMGTLFEIWEYDASGSSKRVWDNRSNGQHVKQQNISVGLISYNKMGDAKWTWKEKEPQKLPAHIAPFESELASSPFKVAYEPGAEFEFRLSVAQHKGLDVLIYTRIKRSRHRAGEVGPEAVNIQIINKYWLGTDGRIVKFEQWDNHRKERSATTLYTWSEWELDPKIVIRAPIIEP